MSDTSAARAQLEHALNTTLAALGIAPGQSLMVHSDAMAVAQFRGLGSQEGMQFFWTALQRYLGAQSTLFVPTFTYALTQGQVYDPATTPSQVGQMTEAFRTMTQSYRNRDPIFSMAMTGNEAESLAARDCTNCFDDTSPFAFLHQQQGMILGLGCHPDRITFTHYVEQLLGVDYRYLKTFSGQRRSAGGEPECVEVAYFVRDLERETQIDLRLLIDELKTRGQWRQALFGRIPVWAVACEDFVEATKALLTRQSNGLIREAHAGR
ncbi:AAC(3) family N-acetyltransferase [Pokkaliibacter sp. CJK22405]|uniref:AAC(3) family N-acetyltransferase n=1 Tax=Pokkaliibacter sp. CJK22405 TaxID=3384615 RepID=UPI003984800D